MPLLQSSYQQNFQRIILWTDQYPKKTKTFSSSRPFLSTFPSHFAQMPLILSLPWGMLLNVLQEYLKNGHFLTCSFGCVSILIHCSVPITSHLTQYQKSATSLETKLTWYSMKFAEDKGHSAHHRFVRRKWRESQLLLTSWASVAVVASHIKFLTLKGNRWYTSRPLPSDTFQILDFERQSRRFHRSL